MSEFNDLLYMLNRVNTPTGRKEIQCVDWSFYMKTFRQQYYSYVHVAENSSSIFLDVVMIFI